MEALAKTPEREDIARLLMASEKPMTSAQIARELDKSADAVQTLLGKLLATGEVVKTRYGK